MSLKYKQVTLSTNSVNDAVDAIQTFLQSDNGWTLDHAGTRSGATGKRLHLHKTSGGDTLYANFGAYKGEARYASGSDNPTGGSGNYTDHVLAMNLSTAFAGSGTDWELQTGAPSNYNSKRCSVEMRSESNTAWPNGAKLHMFHRDDPMMFWAFVELATNEFQFFGFGLPVRAGSHTSGMWITGSENSGKALAGGGTLGANANIGLSNNDADPDIHSSYVYYASVDSTTGWAGFRLAGPGNGSRMARGASYGCSFGAIDSTTWSPQLINNTNPDGPLWRSLGSLNQLAQVVPIPLGIKGDDGLYYPIGQVGNAGFCRIDYLTPGADYTFGGDTYKTLPFRKRGTLFNIGLAVKVS